MRLWPFFFSSPAIKTAPQLIDARPIIRYTREITKSYDRRYLQPCGEGAGDTFHQIWDSGDPSRLMVAVIDAHMSWLLDDSEVSRQRSRLMTSWTSICIAVGMYLTSVLGIPNRGAPPEKRLMYHMLHILRRDLQYSLAGLAAIGRQARDLWLRKMFSGALCLQHAEPLLAEMSHSKS
ncbi:hypothetical protein V1506DRAFT_572942 [Lipomyces tetrasporus]